MKTLETLTDMDREWVYTVSGDATISDIEVLDCVNTAIDWFDRYNEELSYVS